MTENPQESRDVAETRAIEETITQHGSAGSEDQIDRFLSSYLHKGMPTEPHLRPFLRDIIQAYLDQETEDEYSDRDPRNSQLYKFAQSELTYVGMLGSTDDVDQWMAQGTLKIVEAFCTQGHSGGTAGIAINLATKLMNYEPLSPLQGSEDEWMEIAEEAAGQPNLFQNRRSGRVFLEMSKDSSSRAYDIQGIIYERPDGTTFTRSGDPGEDGISSRTPVVFPYIPQTIFVKLDENDRPISETGRKFNLTETLVDTGAHSTEASAD